MAKSPRVKATVGPFTFAYPHLTSPDTEGKFADNKYKVDGIEAPTSDAMKRAKKVVASAAKELGVPTDATLPLAKETEKAESGKREPTGNLRFRTKSQFAPAIVDASGKPIPDKVLAKLNIGPGSEGLIQGYFQAYELTVTERVNGEKVTTKEPGMSFTLTGIQLLKLVKGGSSQADFAAYEGGGFTLDTADLADDDDDADDDDGLAAGLDEDADSDDGGLDI